METVEVRRCLELDGVETCLPKASPWRYITIKPILINNERQRFFIEQLLINPAIERIAEPLKEVMEPTPQKS